MSMMRHVELLRLQRASVARAYEDRIMDLKADAAAQDYDIAAAIADAEAMIGAPEQQQAAE